MSKGRNRAICMGCGREFRKPRNYTGKDYRCPKCRAANQEAREPLPAPERTVWSPTCYICKLLPNGRPPVPAIVWMIEVLPTATRRHWIQIGRPPSQRTTTDKLITAQVDHLADSTPWKEPRQ